MEFKLHSKFSPTGDQPQAIEKLAEGVRDGIRTQVLLGVTGSGKTFTMANVIKEVNRPTLVIAHNKTLAAQLCNEFKEFFPENRVEYFVSYYDYYQPESYIPSTDTYIEKDMSLNDEIDKLRNSATSSLGERRDVIVVASVSCIYGLGAPEEYFRLAISMRPGDALSRDALLWKFSTSVTTPIFTVPVSACAATRWKSFPPAIRRLPSAWNFSATKSTESAKRTR